MIIRRILPIDQVRLNTDISRLRVGVRGADAWCVQCGRVSCIERHAARSPIVTREEQAAERAAWERHAPIPAQPKPGGII